MEQKLDKDVEMQDLKKRLTEDEKMLEELDDESGSDSTSFAHMHILWVGIKLCLDSDEEKKSEERGKEP